MALAESTKAGLISLLVSGALLCHTAHAAPSDPVHCFSQDDLKHIDRDFFGNFPDAEIMQQFASQQKFEIATNVENGIKLQQAGASNGSKMTWLANFLSVRRDFFSDFSRFESPYFTYMKNGVESVDHLTTTQRFPKNQCVQEVNYNITAGPCIRGQKLQSLSLTFVKDDRPLYFAGIELYFMECPVGK